MRHLIFSSIVVIGIVSCMAIQAPTTSIFVGNFEERQYSFFESFSHQHDSDQICNLPYDLKFGGIRPFPFDSTGNKDYSWLRDPENLILAFSTFKSVGLKQFVSQSRYNSPGDYWGKSVDWENKSLNQIVKQFLASDTAAQGQDYYAKFWKRRSIEGNLTATYSIFKQIDEIYNETGSAVAVEKTDPTLEGLISHDALLMRADASQRKKRTLDYFDYLRSVDLHYSAYKLIFNNEDLKLSKQTQDSLLLTLPHDTLTEETWHRLNDNMNGWLDHMSYPDPNRYYGP